MIAKRTNPAVNRRGLTFWGQWLCGVTLVSALLCYLVFEQFGMVSTQYRLLIVITVFCSVPAYMLLHVYHKKHSYLTGLAHLLAGWATLLVGLFVIAFLSDSMHLFSSEVLLNWALYGFLVQGLAYIPLRYFANRHSSRLRIERTSVIIGSGPAAYELAERLTGSNRVPLMGLITSRPDVQTRDGRFPVLGDLSTVREIVEQYGIRRVYIALSLDEVAFIEELYLTLLDMSVDVVWIPDFGRMPLLNQSISQIEQMPAIYLNETPVSSHPASVFSKELMDRSIALLAIIALSPILIASAIGVKLSSPGPVLFRQPRHGWNGEIIHVMKFRSMRQHDDGQVKQATRDDPRVTPFGRFLRKSSIDELPQLFNVLKGEMSLVGPRPHAVTHNDYYSDKIMAYMARHRIKPGITGLAQVTGHRGETETLEKMQQRVEKDLAYINNWSLWLDIKILIKTPFTLFSKDVY
ncbi:putative colanic acid biosysnthesis UDP-glucose lipid carrier transferase [Halopseudomonas xinjiangensis]|uniref:Putative colanic acid biosysnthesis UDP-glucose lipid carrier transferase n=1 Tax=Halopseudomonas xinjiangensis TaxID=487184 RepID=A0A1H1WD84_9GAMM|nr:undecaprenyl-phosphate glucose phosphotransferase [Halopseudomonas xinjiangensis]SDS95083.1 putative colanic acid biosysnthesis UDP-glucose lipid carrier transferase [Halopseudomonas xinjiangensis]